MQIDIPENLYALLAERAAAKGAGEPAEYIVHLLEQIADKIAAAEEPVAGRVDERVKDRLRKFGYLE